MCILFWGFVLSYPSNWSHLLHPQPHTFTIIHQPYLQHQEVPGSARNRKNLSRTLPACRAVLASQPIGLVKGFLVWRHASSSCASTASEATGQICFGGPCAKPRDLEACAQFRIVEGDPATGFGKVKVNPKIDPDSSRRVANSFASKCTNWCGRVGGSFIESWRQCI